MRSDFLLYGANGFLGEVIARLSVQKGLKPILAGRNAAKIKPLAGELGLEHRVFALVDSAALDQALSEVPFVLHCAGPYIHTAKPMVDGCLRTGRHYLDLSGGIIDFQALEPRDAEAQAQKVMLLPGCGFDVVPTDCLALHLKERLPSATHLRLAWRAEGPAKLPPGTLNTMLESAPHPPPGIPVRRHGKIEYAGPEWRTVDFGQGPIKVARFNWGDVFTAFYSTGIPNIDEYVGWTEQQLKQMMQVLKIAPLLRVSFVRNYIKRKVPTSPTPEDRARARMLVWGEVEDDQGHHAVSRLSGPEGTTTWTSMAAVAVAQKVLAGDAPPGFQTPAMAYGADFAVDLPAVTRQDVS